MKRCFAYNRITFFALLIVFSALVSACAGKPVPITPTTPVPVTEAPTAVPTAVPTPEPTPTPVPTPEPTPSPYELTSPVYDETKLAPFMLVNFEHECRCIGDAETQLVELHGNTPASLLLTNNDHRLNSEAVPSLSAFADAFYAETGGDRLLVTSSYRTREYQQNLYNEYVQNYGEEYARMYVADPGASEHHTGLAVDLSTKNKAGERVALINHEKFAWVTEHCADYGFILRYPVGTESITHVAYEPWHFRYLGKELAKAVTAMGMTYEEFCEHIRQYTVESGMLYLSKDLCCPDVAYIENLPEEGYLFYYAPASGLVPVVRGADETVSADNAGGFIVAVKIG